MFEPLHQLPVPVPAVYAPPIFSFFFFHFKKKQRKLGGEEEGHNRAPRTAHSAHTGEQAPRGPGHRTRVCTEGNKETGHRSLAHW